MTADQQVNVMRQLLSWLDKNQNVDSLKIPEMCIRLLHQTENANIINDITFSKIEILRSSFRRFSFRNKVVPSNTNCKPRRSVTFNEVPIIYRIGK